MRFTITPIGLRGSDLPGESVVEAGLRKLSFAAVRVFSTIVFRSPNSPGCAFQWHQSAGIRRYQPNMSTPGFDTASDASISPIAALRRRRHRRFIKSDPNLHAPYTIQSAVSVERQVTKAATVSVTYLNSRGFDQFLTINANAPFPEILAIRTVQSRLQNTYRYVSEGNFKQNQLIANSNVRIGSKVQIFGYYTLNYANSDTSGASSFPSNSYNISQDYGRGAFDIRHRLFLGGSIAFPYLIRLSPFMIVSSGSPFNITSPFDFNGDSQYNNRPGLVSTCDLSWEPLNSAGSAIYCTPLGTFDATGLTGHASSHQLRDWSGPLRDELAPDKDFRIRTKYKECGCSSEAAGGPGGGGGRGGGGPAVHCLVVAGR